MKGKPIKDYKLQIIRPGLKEIIYTDDTQFPGLQIADEVRLIINRKKIDSLRAHKGFKIRFK